MSEVKKREVREVKKREVSEVKKREAREARGMQEYHIGSINVIVIFSYARFQNSS